MGEVGDTAKKCPFCRVTEKYPSGRMGGKIGGKRALETMTEAARTARAYNASQQGRWS